MAHGSPDEPVGRVEEKQRPKAPVGSRRIFPPQFKLQVTWIFFLSPRSIFLSALISYDFMLPRSCPMPKKNKNISRTSVDVPFPLIVALESSCFIRLINLWGFSF